MEDFVYIAHPARVIFGTGTARRLPEEIERLNLQRVLFLSTPPQAAIAHKLSDMVPMRSAGVHAGAVMHTPVAITDAAIRMVETLNVDGLVAVGGGSTIGLAKAIALRTDLPQIALPTTYAGSEMTPILGETQDGIKKTQNNPKVLPETVIYDVELTLSLPPLLSGTSGINAIAHAVEALYAQNHNPVIDITAREAIGALTWALPRIFQEPDAPEARTRAFYGSWLSGICLGTVGMALHHKLCHALGGAFDLPHAETHTVILPHALAYNAPAIPAVMSALQDILGANPALALYELAGKVGAKRGLKDLGMPQNGIDEAVVRTLASSYWNPRPLEPEAIRALITKAWTGDPPASEE